MGDGDGNDARGSLARRRRLSNGFPCRPNSDTCRSARIGLFPLIQENSEQNRWAKWSAIAEILGAVAVVVTLLYLSAQTRYLATQTQQNTAAIQASVRQAMLSEDRESLYKIIEYPFLGRACGLTEEQKVQTQAYLFAFLRMRENYWIQYQNGVLDESTWESYKQPLSSVVLDSEFGRNLWRSAAAGSALEPGFRNSWTSYSRRRRRGKYANDRPSPEGGLFYVLFAVFGCLI